MQKDQNTPQSFLFFSFLEDVNIANLCNKYFSLIYIFAFIWVIYVYDCKVVNSSANIYQATRVVARSLDLDCSSLIRLHVKAKQNISPVTSENRFHCVNPLLIFV